MNEDALTAIVYVLIIAVVLIFWLRFGSGKE